MISHTHTHTPCLSGPCRGMLSVDAAGMQVVMVIVCLIMLQKVHASHVTVFAWVNVCCLWVRKRDRNSTSGPWHTKPIIDRCLKALLDTARQQHHWSQRRAQLKSCCVWKGLNPLWFTVTGLPYSAQVLACGESRDQSTAFYVNTSSFIPLNLKNCLM